MADSLDLEAYLERIKWGGDARPTYDVLRGLLGAHMAAIPFENLDVLFGRHIRLDLDGLQEKLVRARRGGYCFEPGMLFAAVLEAFGFKPVRHTARVVKIVSRTKAPRSHMFLTVPVAEGTFVVDPGFGALAPRLPAPLLDCVERALIQRRIGWRVTEIIGFCERGRPKRISIAGHRRWRKTISWISKWEITT